MPYIADKILENQDDSGDAVHEAAPPPKFLVGQQLSALAALHDAADYSGMTDEETIAAICKRHPGGSMADRVCILYEMRRVGAGDSYAIDQTLSAIVRNIDERIKRSTRPAHAICGANGLYGYEGYGYSGSQFQIAGGSTGWAGVRAMAAVSIAQPGGHGGGSIAKGIMDSIDELLDKLMKEGN